LQERLGQNRAMWTCSSRGSQNIIAAKTRQTTPGAHWVASLFPNFHFSIFIFQFAIPSCAQSCGRFTEKPPIFSIRVLLPAIRVPIRVVEKREIWPKSSIRVVFLKKITLLPPSFCQPRLSCVPRISWLAVFRGFFQ
jgi:hypothetical protein